MKRILSAVLCFVILFSVCASAANNNDLQEVIKKKSQMQKNINLAKDKKEAAKEEYDQIERNMISLQSEINKIDGKLNELETKKQQITEELDKAVENEQKQKDTLKTRLRVMYEDGATSYFKILLSSDSLFDFFYNLERLSQITEYDNKVLKELEAARKTIAQKKKEHEDIMAQVQEQKDIQVAKKNELKKQSDLKVAYMKQLESDIAGYKKNYEKHEAEEARIRAEINAAAANVAPSSTPVKKYTGGKLQWPCPASYNITSPYGYRIHPIFRTSRLHRGIDVAVPTGNAIVAAADGVVIKSTYNSSYGYYVSVSHGSGLVTLYAHNSRLNVSVGQSVKRGQVVAYSGNTGNSTGPHLHFEVMLNGATTNPMNYF